MGATHAIRNRVKIDQNFKLTTGRHTDKTESVISSLLELLTTAKRRVVTKY